MSNNTQSPIDTIQNTLVDIEEALDAIAHSNGIVPPLQPAYDMLGVIEKLVDGVGKELAAARAQAEASYRAAQFANAKLAAVQMILNTQGMG